MWDYTKKVQDHFLHPHNAGNLPDANAIGEVGSIACGDALKLYLKINEQSVIEKAGFETFGCASAIASSSVLTDMIIGKTVDQALKLTNKDIVAALGGLPREKMHCSVMGAEALEAAIRNWRGEPAIPHAQEIGRLVCKCFGVTDVQIVRAIKENNLSTVEEVTNYTKAAGACGECLDQIDEILSNTLGKKKADPQAKKLTNVQRMQMVLQVLATPNILQSGEAVELVDINGIEVSLTVHGQDHQAILEKVEQILRERVEPDLRCVEMGNA